MAKVLGGFQMSPPADIPTSFLTRKQMIDEIRSAGKRAQTRIKALKKAYGKGGEFYGRKSYILDKYSNFNVKTAGLSDAALALKVMQAREILNAKSSTITGMREIDKARFDTFKREHPNIKIPDSDNPLNKGQWETAMKLLGRIQAAEMGAEYDSDEQIALAIKVATGQTNYTPAGLFDANGDLLISSKDFFAQMPLEEQFEFIPPIE